MTAPKKRKFSGFDLRGAMELLSLKDLERWQIDCQPVTPSPFFEERMRRLSECFDIHTTDAAKGLLTDAICEEALAQHPRLRLWKESNLSGREAFGVVDYIVAGKRRYFDVPLACLVKARHDDFEKGEAECLAVLHTCRQLLGPADVYGVVTNGETWVFYKLEAQGWVSLMLAISDMERLLGALNYVFGKCEENLGQWAQAA